MSIRGGTVVKTIKTVFDTLWLGIGFGLLFVLYITLISLLDITWDITTIHFAVPIFLAFFTCFIFNYKSFRFKRKIFSDKISLRRFLLRLITSALFLIAGYIISECNTYGGNVILSSLCNFFLYIIIVVFLLVFSALEYLFVPAQKNTI